MTQEYDKHDLVADIRKSVKGSTPELYVGHFPPDGEITIQIDEKLELNTCPGWRWPFKQKTGLKGERKYTVADLSSKHSSIRDGDYTRFVVWDHDQRNGNFMDYGVGFDKNKKHFKEARMELKTGSASDSRLFLKLDESKLPANISLTNRCSNEKFSLWKVFQVRGKEISKELVSPEVKKWKFPLDDGRNYFWEWKRKDCRLDTLSLGLSLDHKDGRVDFTLNAYQSNGEESGGTDYVQILIEDPPPTDPPPSGK